MQKRVWKSASDWLKKGLLTDTSSPASRLTSRLGSHSMMLERFRPRTCAALSSSFFTPALTRMRSWPSRERSFSK
jgi:hypothetical protein